MSNLYFGKISKKYPEQFSDNFYAAGEKGNKWYGDIQPGDYVFPIYEGKVQKLWKVKEYVKRPNRLNPEGLVDFEVIKEF